MILDTAVVRSNCSAVNTCSMEGFAAHTLRVQLSASRRCAWLRAFTISPKSFVTVTTCAL